MASPLRSSSLKCSQSPSGAPGWSWRSARAGHPYGSGIRRRVCPIARAASRRFPVPSARRRSGRNRPRCALRGQCRHKNDELVRVSPPTSGCRLFMGMRSGASVSQLLAFNSVPVGAEDIADVVTWIGHVRTLHSGPDRPEDDGVCRQARAAGRRGPFSSELGEGRRLAFEMAGLRKLHLDRRAIHRRGDHSDAWSSRP